MRDQAFQTRSFWALGAAGMLQLLVALGLLVALLAIGQRRLVDFVIILPLVAMLKVTAAGALVLASRIWIDLGRRLAAPRLPAFAVRVMKTLGAFADESET